MAEGGEGDSGKINAILIGGTGATGRCLLGSLLRAKDKVAMVTVFGRRKMESVPEEYRVNLTEEEEQGRLRQHVQDLEEVSEDKVKELCAGGHVFFNCMGTTTAIAGSKENFIHIDCEIPLRLIKLAKVAGVKHCSLLTSQGAKPNSFVLYFRAKGQMEESTKAEGFPYTSIFRPGLLDRGGEKRFREKIYGLFSKGMKVSDLAEAMFQEAWSHHTRPAAASTSTPIYDNSAIYNILKEAKPGSADNN